MTPAGAGRHSWRRRCWRTGASAARARQGCAAGGREGEGPAGEAVPGPRRCSIRAAGALAARLGSRGGGLPWPPSPPQALLGFQASEVSCLGRRGGGWTRRPPGCLPVLSPAEPARSVADAAGSSPPSPTRRPPEVQASASLGASPQERQLGGRSGHGGSRSSESPEGRRASGGGLLVGFWRWGECRALCESGWGASAGLPDGHFREGVGEGGEFPARERLSARIQSTLYC